MAKVELNVAWGNLEVESAQEIPLSDPRWAVLANTLRLFASELSPTSVTFDGQNYAITLKDGRTWRQTLLFAAGGDTDPAMTFDVAQGWKLSEFRHHRQVRDWIVAAVSDFGLTSLQCSWDGEE